MTKRKKANAKIDLRAALEAPVKLKHGGQTKSMPAYEATLRQQVKKALADQSLPSMKFVIGEAEKHEVIEQPPPPEVGGVFVVPKQIPLETQKEIFGYRPEGDAQEPMERIWGIIRNWIKTIKAELKANDQDEKR